MSSMGIKFVPLPEPLQKRLTRVMKKVESGEINANYGSDLFMSYFAQRIAIIADNSPNPEKLHQNIRGKRLALIIKGTAIDHVATFQNKITEFTLDSPSKLTDPAMIFINMDVFLEVILSKKELMEAGIQKQVEVRKLAQTLRWLAPIVALQNDNTLNILKEKCPPILDRIVAEIERKYGLT